MTDIRHFMTICERDVMQNAQFRAWFGHSKIVDANGEPMVVYHGTDRDFAAFSSDHVGSRTDYGFWGKGFYFMNDPEWASGYAELEADPNGAPNVRPCYLRMEHPYYYAQARQTERYDPPPNSWPRGTPEAHIQAETAAFTKRIRAAGHDGIIVKGGASQSGHGFTTEYVVFQPNQIKGVFNRGSFNPDDDRMTENTLRRFMMLCEAAVPLDKDENPLIDMDNRPIATNRDGTVTLYHRTSEAAAKQIKRTGRFTSRESTQEVYFSNIPDGQAASFGDYVVEVKVHPNRTRLTDAMHGEMYLAVPTRYLSARNITVIYAAPDDDQTLGEGAALFEEVDVESAAFRTWFAGSKVVDAYSDPLLCYHGSHHWNADIKQFRPLTHFGTVKAANSRIRHQERLHYESAIYPVYLSIKNPVQLVDRRGVQHDVYRLADYLAFGTFGEFKGDAARRNARSGLISLDDYDAIRIAEQKSHGAGIPVLIELASKQGYDGFVYRNAVEDRGSTSWVIFGAAQVWPLYANGAQG
jgi:hypothetical protein